jgi:hypothetical protein
MDLSERIAELDALTESLADEPCGAWLSRCIADSLRSKLDAEQRPRTAVAVYGLLTSGLAGPALLEALSEHFGDVSRWDLFYGAVLAVTDLSTRLTLIELEWRIARDGRRAAA